MELKTTNFLLIETQIWDLLEQAVVNHKAHFHTGTIITCVNNIPYARTVVVRAADREKRTIRFHTDSRSVKISQLQANPATSWLFYSKELRLQLRIAATATLHTNDSIADEAWTASRISSKMCYTTHGIPGTIIEAPEQVNFNQNEMSVTEEMFARKNFCVVETIVQSIDWLYLHHEGHKRCCIDYISKSCAWLQV